MSAIINGRKRAASSAGASDSSGIDLLLTNQGKHLRTGESISFRLIKGPSYITGSGDPVDPKAPTESFPLIAKFPECVVKPNFLTAPWNTGRLYQQDVPKPPEDSDEEAAAAQQKKRWKYRRHDVASRQWILQEQVDFLETMVARREKRQMDPKRLSSRYEGVVEHNPSQYVLFTTTKRPAKNADHDDDDDDHDDNYKGIIQVRTLPPSHCSVTFCQPASRKTLSLSEAELAIQDQRSGIRTFHNVAAGGGHSADGAGDDSTAVAPPRRLILPKKPNDSKSRLLNKLQAKSKALSLASGEENDEGDDVMGDITFRNRKGGGAARKELITSLGDGVTVSDDGVLGGTNDAAFGGRQRFGTFQAEQNATATDANAPDGGKAAEDEAGGVGTAERGADGAAMNDDFYQRDVQAEYDELDYDANEQFDDDDVDLGESEMQGDAGGFADDEGDDDMDDMDLEEEVISGAEGLASVAGFKLMLAKARGEIQPDGSDGSTASGLEKKDQDENFKNSLLPGGGADSNKKDDGDHIAKIMAAAEKSAIAAKEKAAAQQKQQEAAKKATAAASVIQMDENGLRVVSLDAVRREIWLNHGSIPMKRLVKIFDIKKKHGPERQDKFREVVKELCTMQSDPLGGRLLVLKQHYSNL